MALSGSKTKIDRLQCHTNHLNMNWMNKWTSIAYEVFILLMLEFSTFSDIWNRTQIGCSFVNWMLSGVCLCVLLPAWFFAFFLLLWSENSSNKIDYRVISRHLFHFDGFTQPKYVLFCRFDYRHIDRFLLTMRKTLKM